MSIKVVGIKFPLDNGSDVEIRERITPSSVFPSC